MANDRTNDPKNVSEAIALIRETREAIGRGDQLLADLTSSPPSVLNRLVEPTLRIRERMLAEIAELERIAENL